MLRFFQQMNEKIQEVIIEKIKNSMDQGYCDGIVMECISFFRQVKQAMQRNLDTMSIFKSQKEVMERSIHPINLEYLTGLLEKHIKDYEVLRDEIMNEREYLTSLFKKKTEEFNLAQAGQQPPKA